MRGIDISHYNGWPFDYYTAKAYEESDFVIVKATQWESKYKYESYFAPAIKKVLADGKLAGAYHYATGKDPIKEADYFLSVVKPYLGQIVLALDWERGQNDAWNKDTKWCSTFVDRVKEKTGLTCFLYTGMDGFKDCKNLANKVPLWFAGYPNNNNSWAIPKWPSHYSTKPWSHYDIWQFTSGGDKIDRNITNMTPTAWGKYTVSEAEKPAVSGSTLDLVIATMQGKYGNGDARREKLGTRYQEVQTMINHIARTDAKTLAKETMQGLYGNGDIRKAVLGDKYAAVQKIVNETLNG